MKLVIHSQSQKVCIIKNKNPKLYQCKTIHNYYSHRNRPRVLNSLLGTSINRFQTTNLPISISSSSYITILHSQAMMIWLQLTFCLNRGSNPSLKYHSDSNPNSKQSPTWSRTDLKTRLDKECCRRSIISAKQSRTKSSNEFSRSYSWLNRNSAVRIKRINCSKQL